MTHRCPKRIAAYIKWKSRFLSFISYSTHSCFFLDLLLKYFKRLWLFSSLRLVDLSLLNSYILYSKNSDNPISRKDYLSEVVCSLVEPLRVPNLPPAPAPGPSGDVEHKIAHLPGRSERLCVVCGHTKKRGKSHFWCPPCNCGVHRECFPYLEHYWRPLRPGKKRRVVDVTDSDWSGRKKCV